MLVGPKPLRRDHRHGLIRSERGLMATTVTTRQLPRRPVLQISSVVIASIAVALIAVAVSPRLPATSRLTPSDIIDKFLSARQMGDVDTATNLFQSDVTFTDSAG